MIKILYIIDTLRRGGKERQFVELIKGLDRSKYEIHTIALEKRMDGYDDVVKNLSHYFEYKFRKFRWDISLIKYFVRYCKQHKIDIIQVWDGMSAFYGYFTSLFSGVKFINYSIQGADQRLTYRHIYERILLKLSKYVLANQYAGLRIYGLKKKGKVIYNGIDLNRFSHIRDKNNDKFVIGIVANLTEYKDYYTFFNAIRILQDRISNFEVHIIGGGRLTQTYKDYAVKIGVNQSILKYFGRVSNVEDYIPNFDVGVLCSYKEKGEGLSNSVLEYMACGVPPIITDVGAAREIVEEGITGFLFEAENAQDLANKILLLYNDYDLRLRIGERAKEEVFKRFGYERYIREMEEYYEMVMKS